MFCRLLLLVRTVRTISTFATAPADLAGYVGTFVGLPVANHRVFCEESFDCLFYLGTFSLKELDFPFVNDLIRVMPLRTRLRILNHYSFFHDTLLHLLRKLHYTSIYILAIVLNKKPLNEGLLPSVGVQSM